MIHELGNQSPSLGDDVFVAPSADVVGDVTIGDRSSLWFGVVARGDVDRIEIGSETNIQDNSILHLREGMPLTIGDRVTVGHGARLHACTVEKECLIGINAVVLDGATVSTHSMVAAGSVVTPGTEVPPGAVFMGSPASFERNLREDELDMIHESAESYVDRGRQYLDEHETTG
jgi:carbonic anhydrase/acetyltransferase-like protein (isoleucine patch superfamily)